MKGVFGTQSRALEQRPNGRPGATDGEAGTHAQK